MKSANNSKRTGAVSPLLVVLILCIGGIGALGTLWWTGSIDLPALDFLKKGSTSEAQSREGKIAVPIAARDVSAYTKVRRDDFWLPETQEFASVWLDEDVVKERGIMTAREALNRVLAVDKKKGYSFSEDDFLPLGTREGPSAGIGPGMRGLRVSAASIQGLHGLRRGDRFDLIASKSIEKRKGSKGSSISPLAQAAAKEDESWEVSTRIIVQNGKLVEPVRPRRAVANGGRVSQVEEAFLGVAEAEITRLTEALALGAEILCVPRSAIPGAGGTDLMAHARPDGPGVVEVYSNGKRSLTYVPRGRDYVDRYEPDFYEDEAIAVEQDTEVAVAEPEPPLEEPEIVEPEVVIAKPVQPEVVPEVEQVAIATPIEATMNVIDEPALTEASHFVEEVAVPEPVNVVEEPAPAAAEVEELTNDVVVAPVEEQLESMSVMDAIVAQDLGAEVSAAQAYLSSSTQIDEAAPLEEASASIEQVEEARETIATPQATEVEQESSNGIAEPQFVSPVVAPAAVAEELVEVPEATQESPNVAADQAVEPQSEPPNPFAVPLTVAGEVVDAAAATQESPNVVSERVEEAQFEPIVDLETVETVPAAAGAQESANVTAERIAEAQPESVVPIIAPDAIETEVVEASNVVEAAQESASVVAERVAEVMPEPVIPVIAPEATTSVVDSVSQAVEPIEGVPTPDVVVPATPIETPGHSDPVPVTEIAVPVSDVSAAGAPVRPVFVPVEVAEPVVVPAPVETPVAPIESPVSDPEPEQTPTPEPVVPSEPVESDPIELPQHGDGKFGPPHNG